MTVKFGIRISLVFYCFLYTSVLMAQKHSIQGKIFNNNLLPLEFVTVILTNENTMDLRESITDSVGFFRFKAEKGMYTLRAERLGNRLFSKEIDLVNDLNLGAVKIDETIVLEEVAVTGRRGLIERKVDRLVYNIENSIVSQGVNGLEALKNTPLVRIQNENISIAGKGSVSVIINDRMINLSQAELANYLQSLRSDNIAKIEVITAAPIKI